MSADLPLLFQFPVPVGCSPAVLHLCSEDPGALETEWRGGCYTVCVREGEKARGGRKSRRRKVGQDQPTGVLEIVIGAQNAIATRSDASTHVLSFRHTWTRVTYPTYRTIYVFS